MELFQYKDIFDLQQMWYVCSVAYYGSISHAARNMFISQPALSRYISQAEKKIGSPLFDRSATPLTLAAVGEKYVEYATRILKLQEKMASDINEICQNTKSRLIIGMDSDQAAFIQPPLAREFARIRDNVSLEISAGYWDSLYRRMKARRVDFVVYSENEGIFQPDLEARELYRERMYFAAPAGLIPESCLADGRPDVVDPEILFRTMGDKLHWLLQVSGFKSREVTDNLFEIYNHTPKNATITYGDSTIYRMVAAGTGVSFVREETLRLVRPDGPVSLYELKGVPRDVGIYLVYLKSRDISGLDQAFLDCMDGIPWERILKA